MMQEQRSFDLKLGFESDELWNQGRFHDSLKNKVFHICSFSKSCNASSVVRATEMSHIREKTKVQRGDIWCMYLISSKLFDDIPKDVL